MLVALFKSRLLGAIAANRLSTPLPAMGFGFLDKPERAFGIGAAPEPLDIFGLEGAHQGFDDRCEHFFEMLPFFLGFDGLGGRVATKAWQRCCLRLIPKRIL